MGQTLRGVRARIRAFTLRSKIATQRAFGHLGVLVSGVEMYARLVIGAREFFLEVSSIQGCPYSGVPLYTHMFMQRIMHCTCTANLTWNSSSPSSLAEVALSPPSEEKRAMAEV